MGDSLLDAAMMLGALSGQAGNHCWLYFLGFLVARFIFRSLGTDKKTKLKFDDFDISEWF